MELVIAEKYAVALLQVAKDRKTVDAVSFEMKAIQNAVKENPGLKLTLEKPRLKAEEKIDALCRCLGEKLSGTMENFLTLLILKKRIQHLDAVADYFERLCYEMKGKAIARVLTAVSLTAGQKETLARKLSQMFGLTVELREEVKPGLIGGVLIYFGDQRMNGTVLGQLERMKQRLLKVEIE